MTETKTVKGWVLPAGEIHFEEFLTTNKECLRTGEYQKDQRVKALSQVTSFRRAIDIGACVGFWSKDLCERFEAIECFEPLTDPIACLRENLSGYDNWTAHQVALSDWRGTTDFAFNERSIGHSSIVAKKVTDPTLMRTKVAKLDDFNFSDVDFIKIDVQFHELQVLRGARRTLERNSPVLCVECGRRTSREYIYVARIIEFLFDLGYQIVGEKRKEIFFRKNAKPRFRRHLDPVFKRLNYTPFT